MGYSDEYWTPKWVFDQMNITFVMDVASPVGGPKHTPAPFYIDKVANGLETPWRGRVWMNPPFSKATPWVDKFIEHRDGVALLPFAKSAWCNKIWNCADAITMLPSNLRFETDDERTGSISIHTMLVAFGPESVAAIARIGKMR